MDEYLNYALLHPGHVIAATAAGFSLTWLVKALSDFLVDAMTAPPVPLRTAPIPTPAPSSAKDRYLTWCKNNPTPFSLPERVRIKLLGMTPELRAKKAQHQQTQARLSRDHSAEMRERLEATTVVLARCHNRIGGIMSTADELKSFVVSCSKEGK